MPALGGQKRSITGIVLEWAGRGCPPASEQVIELQTGQPGVPSEVPWKVEVVCGMPGLSCMVSLTSTFLPSISVTPDPARGCDRSDTPPRRCTRPDPSRGWRWCGDPPGPGCGRRQDRSAAAIAAPAGRSGPARSASCLPVFVLDVHNTVVIELGLELHELAPVGPVDARVQRQCRRQLMEQASSAVAGSGRSRLPVSVKGRPF